MIVHRDTNMVQIIYIVTKLKLHRIKSLKHGTKYISWVGDKDDDCERYRALYRYIICTSIISMNNQYNLEFIFLQ